MLPNVDSPATRDEIVAALDRLHLDSAGYWARFDTPSFFARVGDAWSPAENLRHLIKSGRAVAKALRLPRLFLWLLFGRPRRPSIPYDELVTRYLGVLAEGGKAGRFAPSPHAETDLTAWREKIMAQREQVHRQLVAAARSWPEPALDRYCIKHPLLGNVTVREMLFFTLYHNLHHVEVVEKRRATA
jgi:hypothetical protein